jgi:hypothetical protein
MPGKRNKQIQAMWRHGFTQYVIAIEMGTEPPCPDLAYDSELQRAYSDGAMRAHDALRAIAAMVLARAGVRQ